MTREKQDEPTPATGDAPTSSSESDPRWDDSGSFKTQADDPTAMWDERALQEAGLKDIIDARPAPQSAPPATAPDVRGSDDSRVVVTRAPTPAPGAVPVAPAATSEEPGGLSWPVVIGLAVALAVAVFFLVRSLR